MTRRTSVNGGENLFPRPFVIEPEFLMANEIQHELKARGLNAQGENRIISEGLRKAISHEQRDSTAVRLITSDNATGDFEYVNANKARVDATIRGVTLDPVTQNRFMSVFLHLDGRIQRVPHHDGTTDVTMLSHELSDQLQDKYQAFVSKVRLLKSKHRRANPNAIIHDNGSKRYTITKRFSSSQQQFYPRRRRSTCA